MLFLLRISVAAALLVGGLVAARITHDRARSAARSTAEAVADSFSDGASSTAQTVIAGLGGAAAIVRPDGSVDPGVFETFRRDLSTVSPLETLGLVPIVAPSGRTRFEQDLGRDDHRTRRILVRRRRRA